VYIHGSVRLLTDDSGQNVGAVGSFSDVTSLVQANARIALLERSSTHREAFERLVGSTNIMQEVYRRIRLAADSDVTVFISGESGTGKELAAQAIHAQSDRRDKPFIAVNCSAIPETLLESELFGHIKGAFTGAVKDKTGMFQAAEGGTLFLDEIGDVSPLLQLKLLRVLQEREIRRVGDERPIHVDVRVVTATNRDLKELIKQGSFREDFYYRIHVFEIALPPLRERQADIPLLVQQFIREFSETHRKQVSGIARDALQQLTGYAWPGNVRELRNAIEHAFVTVQGETITLLDLPPDLRDAIPAPSVEPRRTVTPTAVATPSPKSDLTPDELAEKQQLQQVLVETGGNKAEAARRMGFSRVTMWKKARKYGIQ
ncbi:MAG: sigma 54-interacting transcriptional regulator, partial [Planctomycetaceae bacterium]|nr:sigma 54-interacting transcriptional regulator [Planctomycetaceae bacterium]